MRDQLNLIFLAFKPFLQQLHAATRNQHFGFA